MKLCGQLAIQSLSLLAIASLTAASTWSNVYRARRDLNGTSYCLAPTGIPVNEGNATTPTSSSSAPASSSSSSLENSTSVFTGDTQCGASMCVSAIVNSNSTVTYLLQSKNTFPLGWMAIGYGSHMPNSPMVIMWSNSDKSITLSQREAAGHSMPTIVNNPPRIATPDSELSVTQNTDNVKFAFSIPANSDTKQNIIYAFGTGNPNSNSTSAVIFQHVDQGIMTLNLQGKSGSLNPIAPPTGATNNSSAASPKGAHIPFHPYEKRIIAHAFFSSFGFFILLPIGALVARWLRTVIPTKWMGTHISIQFLLSGPFILIGFALGLSAVSTQHAAHFDTPHKRLGLVLFLFYIVIQAPLGAFIHYFKDPNRTHRPPQNFAHAWFGLLIIALSCWQVWLGFQRQWNLSTGRGNAPRGTYIFWVLWTVIIWTAYAVGLSLIFKQGRAETDAREQASLRRKVEQPIR